MKTRLEVTTCPLSPLWAGPRRGGWTQTHMKGLG